MPFARTQKKKQMRSESQMFDLILSVAKNDERVRAVILNGSRANVNIVKDGFQDFDIVYLVKELNSFLANPDWIDVFGDRIILQTPNSMNLYEEGINVNKEEFVYLMLFKDHNRIDLSLIKVGSRKNDSLTKVLLDKDNVFKEIPDPNDRAYWLVKPSQKEFSDCCNEFWWVVTYVVKALLRDEIIYAKEMQETVVRKMFMHVIAWNVAADHGFEVNLGANNRFIKKYLDPKTMSQVKNTYADFTKGNIWNSLLAMSDGFHEKSIELASKMNLHYHLDEARNVREYIQQMKNRF